MTRFISWLLASFVLGAPLIASGAPITVPAGLNPGDHYRLAFVTSSTRDSASPNIADYNAFVTTAANSSLELAALGTTWTAIGSTVAVWARDNTSTNPNVSSGYPVYNLAGSLVAANNSELWGATFTTFLSAPVNITESGAAFDGLVWTGTHEDGTGAGIYSLGYPAPDRYAGTSDSVSRNWMSSTGIGPYTVPRPLYAISDVLTVVPEPSTMHMAFLALSGLVVITRYRRKVELDRKFFGEFNDRP
jgi:hypothetical protein